LGRSQFNRSACSVEPGPRGRRGQEFCFEDLDRHRLAEEVALHLVAAQQAQQAQERAAREAQQAQQPQNREARGANRERAAAEKDKADKEKDKEDKR